MRRNRNVKILATIGPASSEEAMLKKLFKAGADVFRINMSHTPHVPHFLDFNHLPGIIIRIFFTNTEFSFKFGSVLISLP